MVNIFDAPAEKVVRDVADELKKQKGMQPPEWAKYCKTGVQKERAPVAKDWWYLRSAAVLRSIYKLGPVGVAKLRVRYGGRKRRGHKPGEFRKGSGNVIRTILQQLETCQLAQKSNHARRKGRVVSPKGLSLLAKAAKKHIPVKPKNE